MWAYLGSTFHENPQDLPQVQEPILELSSHERVSQTNGGMIQDMPIARPLAGMGYAATGSSEDPINRRKYGIYYTPPQVAEVMAGWAVRSFEDSVLEPCFGSGIFLQTLKEYEATHSIQVYGVEKMAGAYRNAIDSDLLNVHHAILGDFLEVTPFKVDTVIGNPPYVRLRSLPHSQEVKARKTAEEVLGIPVDPASSLWLVFLLHATRFLSLGGRLAFVLPYEMTHVRYAKPLWKFLSTKFGDLRILRVKERLFPELMQEVVVLLADNLGGVTETVSFAAYNNLQDLVDGTPALERTFAVKDILHDRPFVRALLPKEIDELLQERVYPLTLPVPEVCTFNIGYVSGNKEFFHPSADTIDAYGLPQESLRNTVVASRDLRAAGLHTSSIDPAKLRKLFHPRGSLSSSESEYILHGEQEEIDSGYKCRSRTPWYRVPDVRVPDLVLSVFREVPVLMVNDRKLVASNSILCGFLGQPEAANRFVAAWYTSLTLLQCELQVHSLGGGIPILIPGEVSRIRIPNPRSLPSSHLYDLDKALMTNQDPYEVGDSLVLEAGMGLSSKEIELIREGVRVLSQWRKAHQLQSSGKRRRSIKYIHEDVSLLEGSNDTFHKSLNGEIMFRCT